MTTPSQISSSLTTKNLFSLIIPPCLKPVVRATRGITKNELLSVHWHLGRRQQPTTAPVSDEEGHWPPTPYMLVFLVKPRDNEMTKKLHLRLTHLVQRFGALNPHGQHHSRHNKKKRCRSSNRPFNQRRCHRYANRPCLDQSRHDL